MTTRASNPTDNANPYGSSLLDASRATPADVNMDIFAKKQSPAGGGAPQKSQGTVSTDYLARTREEDPWPAESSCAPKSVTPAKTGTVTLSDCRIDTPQEDLATDQPFKMSCLATSADGKPLTGSVRFKLYCTLPDGTEEDTNHAVTGKLDNGRYCADGTLFSPKKPVEWGAMLKYHVMAEHGAAEEKVKSEVVEVEGYMPPKPVAVWRYPSSIFIVGTPFIDLNFGGIFDDFAMVYGQHQDPVISIGYLGPEPGQGIDKLLGEKRVMTLYCILAKDGSRWQPIYNEYLDNVEARKHPFMGLYLLAKNGPQSEQDRMIKFYFDELYQQQGTAPEFVGLADKQEIQWSVFDCSHCDRDQSETGYVVAFYPHKQARGKRMRMPCKSLSLAEEYEGGIKHEQRTKCTMMERVFQADDHSVEKK